MGDVEDAILREMAEASEEIARIAADVNRDLPGRSTEARLLEAMRRGRGRHNPRLVLEALEKRTPDGG